MSDCLVSQVKLGLLGVNVASLSRLHPLISDGVVDIVAIIDPSEEYCFAVKTLCCNARRYEQFDHLLSCDLDGIIIASPASSHLEEVTKSLEKGFPVFCPMSLGRSVAEARSITNCAILNDCLLQVDLSYRYLEELKRVKALFKSNWIGEVFSIDAVYHSGIPPEYGWCYEKEYSGGGCLQNFGLHIIDLILWIFDYPEVKNPTGKLYNKGRCISHTERIIEDYAVIQMEFENDCVVQIRSGWDVHIGCDAELCISIYGSEGGVRIRNLNGCLDSFQVQHFRKTDTQYITDEVCINSKNAMSTWIDLLVSGNVGYNPEMEQYMALREIIDGIYNNSIT